MKPKKQHYVPRFILRNFTYGKSNKIWVFDKRKGKSFCSSPTDSACENYFYEVSESFHKIEMEGKLSSIETVCAPIFKNIISEKSLKNISQNEHRLLCLFTTIQHIRTKGTREKIQKINDSLVSLVEGLQEMTSQDVINSHVLNLNNLPGELVIHLINKRLSLSEAPNDQSFFISDNPVTLHNYFPRKDRGNLGLGLKGIEIYLPISPKLCLVFTCEETVNMIKEKVNSELLRRSTGLASPLDISESIAFVDNLSNPLSKKLKSENVLFYNSLQVVQSSRFVYSNINNFELVEDMLNTNPEIKYSPEIISNVYSEDV